MTVTAAQKQEALVRQQRQARRREIEAGRAYPARQRRHRGRSNIRHALREDGIAGLVARFRAWRVDRQAPAWKREAGVLWVRRQRNYTARVTLGRGGWHWVILDADGAPVAECKRPTQRNRKARRTAQKMLLRMGV